MRQDYKIYGDRTQKFYVIINAESHDLAWESALRIPAEGWTEIPTNDMIEPYNVVELEVTTK
jgi:uncharacterized protein YbdZ (MbtH family)